MIDISRPEKAPESLSTGKYDGMDVVYALHEAFLGKCYLCETKIEPGTFEIDHLKPKAEDQFPELRSTWTNLFPTCNVHRCNARRMKKYPDGGLLDPSSGDDVENRIRQKLDGMNSVVLRVDVHCRFEAIRPDDVAAHNTANELDRIHNGTGSVERARETAKALRSAIKMHIARVATHVREYLQVLPEAHERREKLRNELCILFGRKAPYTMLVRSYFSHRPELLELFEKGS